MKVIHIITALNQGGAEESLFRLAKELNSSGIDQTIISLKESESALKKKFIENGIPVISLKIGGRYSLIGFYRLIKYLKKESNSHTIIQSWMYHGDFFTSLASLFVRKKIWIIWNIRQSLYPTKGMTGLIAKMNAYWSKLIPEKIVCCAYAALKSHAKNGYYESKMQVIHNGIDTELYRPNKESRAQFRTLHNINEEAVLIGVIGRYHPIKGHKEFLEAILKIDLKHYSAHILLVGRDIQSASLLKPLINHPKLKPYLTIIPENREIPYTMSALDILCLPSHNEGFPNVVAEAMSCEVPCVITDVGDAVKIVEDTGISCKSNAPELLLTALLEMLNKSTSERRALGEKARKRIIEEFSLKKTLHSYLEIYQAVIKNKK